MPIYGHFLSNFPFGVNNQFYSQIHKATIARLCGLPRFVYYSRVNKSRIKSNPVEPESFRTQIKQVVFSI